MNDPIKIVAGEKNIGAQDNQISTRAANISVINIPEYYRDTIPVAMKPTYDVLGIHYVHIRAKGIDYYVYAGCLLDVVEKYKLYA